MRTEQLHWDAKGQNAHANWISLDGKVDHEKTQLVIAFGSSENMQNVGYSEALLQQFPHAKIIGCSTAGEIRGTHVYDHELTATAVEFDQVRLESVDVNINDFDNSFEAGKALVKQLEVNQLKHIFLLSDGLLVNGTELVAGCSNLLPEHIAITGGLSGDDDRFEKTFTWHNQKSQSGMIVAVGFYGDHLKVGYGSVGGWDPFGPDRLVTRSEGNVLYELDGQSALTLYKQYLGKYADDLPASGLLFPLTIYSDKESEQIVRTILAVNEAEGSLTFAGDIPQGVQARLMKANFDRLIDGASHAAENSYKPINTKPELAILISCVGRKMVLKQRIEDEVESVSEILGETTPLTGFYSYGEISPLASSGRCTLHNQTMTITTFSEH